jgi:hypothetical protein
MGSDWSFLVDQKRLGWSGSGSEIVVSKDIAEHFEKNPVWNVPEVVLRE